MAFNYFSEALLPWGSLPLEKKRGWIEKLCILLSVSGWEMKIRRFMLRVKNDTKKKLQRERKEEERNGIR